MNTLINTQPTVSEYGNTNYNTETLEITSVSSEIPELVLSAVIVLEINGKKEHLGAFLLKSNSFYSDEAIYSNLGNLKSKTDSYFNSLMDTVKSQRNLPKSIIESILNDFARNPRMLDIIDSDENVDLTIILPHMSVNYKSSEVIELLNDTFNTPPVI